MARTRRQFVGAVASTTLVGLAGCTGGGGADQDTTTTTDSMDTTTTTTTTTSGPSKTIQMVNTTFDPVRASVDPGTTVTWVNKDGFGHTVKSAQFHDVAASWSFESKTLGQGETTSYTFDSAGVYEYYCTIHGKSTMCGVVLVGDAALEKSLPCESGGGSDTTTTTTDDGYEY